LARAQAAHPTDYFYALADAHLQPLAAAPGQPSPRFRALNRALALCPSCEAVHVEVARSLWTLGHRPQALLEWRLALELQPREFSATLGELFRKGAKPEELASIGTFDPARMVEVAGFLSSVGRLSEAFRVLDQAEAMAAAPQETMLMRARLQIQDGQAAAAEKTLADAKSKGVLDPRMPMFEAQLAVGKDKGAAGADRALEILDAGAVRYPTDVAIQRLRVDLISAHSKWAAASRALEGYKRALYARDGSATDAHIAAARIFVQLSRWTDALGEYRIALADQPGNVALWMELGGTAELAGRITVAYEAYSQAARLSPNNPTVVNAGKALDERRRQLSQPFLGASSGSAAPQ
jgi:tetratricopeptide (TPR) repeat protein